VKQGHRVAFEAQAWHDDPKTHRFRRGTIGPVATAPAKKIDAV